MTEPPTWWREGHEVYKVLIKCHAHMEDRFEPDENSNLLYLPVSYAERDLIAEQLWAISQGLA